MTRTFRVGDWFVEPDLNRITRGSAVSIEPKVMDVLVCLAEHAGEVLSKAQILCSVWPGTYVSSEVLTYSISALRRAFGDDAKSPLIIQTIPRKGYRLIAEVVRDAPASPPTPSIAVLAFCDMSPERDQEYFCDGIAEEIINSLTHLKGLRVAARTSSFAFKRQPEDVRAIGAKLGVATVMEGSVRKVGSQLRIAAQLVNVADGCQLWSARFDRELQDVFAIQDEIARHVVQALQVDLSDTEQRQLGRVTTRNAEAYDFYLRGRQFFYRFKRRGIECALEMLSRATKIDPGYALAYAGMADCHAYLYMYFTHDRLYLELAREMSQIALELDPGLAEAHSSRGLAVSLSKRYDEAEREFLAAIELDPLQFEAHYFYARMCFAQGRLEDAVRLCERAEKVKPEDCQAPALLALACRTLGQTDKAEAAHRRTLAKVEKALDLNPDDSRALYLGATALVELGERDRGVDWARRSYALDPEDPYIVYGIACFHSRLGKTEEAVRYFEQAVRSGFSHLEWVYNDSNFDAVRNHSRFRAALTHLKQRDV